jgi:hypothetical protein
MKKVILVLAICLGVSFAFTSCKKEKKEEVKTEEVEVVNEVETKEMTSNTLYQCPMNCEKGKSYIKEGSCPVCKMNLKPKEVDMDSDSEYEEDYEMDADHHNHDTEGDDNDSRIMKDAKVESTPNN